ncbi:alpha/beta hydrolase-fold protein [Mucilaginibacter calamicampi]|uniref:Alpha/beta hydrolase-fold protein n=1 Tax=Mucilaginibacter calamicampi TaxID=1302352 RepID=A0ABW2Z0J4_9SPHI
MKFKHIILFALAACLSVNCASGQQVPSKRVILFGTTIDPIEQQKASAQLAKSVGDTKATNWRAKGDQKSKYAFADAGMDMPYRLYIPSAWDGKSQLPLVMFLHGAFNDENSYVDADDKLMVKLAEQHGFALVSVLGYTKLGAYGTSLKLPAVFGNAEAAVKLRTAVTPELEKTLELSEKDVINVLEIVKNEYPIDKNAMFLTGHSMGSGGTWYIGAKYNQYWKAIAPMSGPFVEEATYPWERIKDKYIFITEGTGATPSFEASRKMYAWMKEKGFKVDYKEVNADHGGMVHLVLPDVFDFFDHALKAK